MVRVIRSLWQDLLQSGKSYKTIWGIVHYHLIDFENNIVSNIMSNYAECKMIQV